MTTVLTTAEAAHRLGVKPQTLYAYVSRGLLTSRRRPGTRGSVFDADEVDRLAGRGRADRVPTGVVETVRTAITSLDGDDLHYRGHRAVDLARTASFEAVARLLWTGELTDGPFEAPADLVALVRRAVAVLPPTARRSDHLRVGVAVLGAADPLRADPSPAAFARTGARVIAVLTAALAAREHPTVAGRLSSALPGAPAPELLDPVLVLLADHGLAVSTLAARVAASARATPYSVLAAGLAAADGDAHGSASTVAHRFLAEALADPLAALAERWRAGVAVPGFGHVLYATRDPRAEALLETLPDGAVREAVEVLRDAVDDLPNVDLALAAFQHAHGLPGDAGELLFEVARLAGWVAHGLEELAEPSVRFRAAGLYTGEPPRR
ncbi:citrate/2-methylcitrate synthase [Kineococcus rubinsiae]|uniref:citrate/2-methylcitrate synthase n=1 Tax=Kineococcus rubinsiae TaxID=2609562 RepID=UPI00142F42EA|nr:citrate/2-methylcitrate synthase [Kineococcus rubinsiae]NIZ92260.1 helix-turn-helix domain-containing protein [Kineococcus rubinsiae]